MIVRKSLHAYFRPRHSRLTNYIYYTWRTDLTIYRVHVSFAYCIHGDFFMWRYQLLVFIRRPVDLIKLRTLKEYTSTAIDTCRFQNRTNCTRMNPNADDNIRNKQIKRQDIFKKRYSATLVQYPRSVINGYVIIIIIYIRYRVVRIFYLIFSLNLFLAVCCACAAYVTRLSRDIHMHTHVYTCNRSQQNASTFRTGLPSTVCMFGKVKTRKQREKRNRSVCDPLTKLVARVF